MLLELLEAVEFGKEVGGIAQGLINGDHYDAVDKAISMCDAIDYNAPTWREEINEILDTISCVNKNDRAFVRAAATYIRACCYFDLGNYAKSRQSISECSMISVDSWTINKDVILDFQKRAKELRKEIDKQTKPHPQISAPSPTQSYPQQSYHDRKRINEKREQKQQKPKQIQEPCCYYLYSRSELLRIIADCCGDNPNQVAEDSCRGGDTDTMISNLKSRYGITISKTQANKSSLYRGLIDYIVEHTSQDAMENDAKNQAYSDMPYILVKNVSRYQNPYDSFNSYVQCTGEFKGKNARFNAQEIVIENSSSNILYSKQCSVSVFQYGSFIERGVNNSIKVGDSVRIVIPNLNPQSIMIGSKIYNATDYFAKQGKTQVGIDIDGMPIWGTIGTENEPFEMTIVGHFHIEGRGEIVTGTISSGAINSGTTIFLSNEDTVVTARVEAIEMFKRLFSYAEKGDNVGILLSGVSYSDIHEGMRAMAFNPKEIINKVGELASLGNYNAAMAIMKSNAHHEGCHVFYFMMAKQYLREGLFQNALDSLHEAELLFPPDDELSQSLIHFDRGRALYGLKQYNEARDSFVECLSFSSKCRYKDEQLGISGQIPDLAQSEIDKIDSILSNNKGTMQGSRISDNEQEYLDEYKECLADGEIGPRERRLLDKLASKLGISPERASELEASLSASALTDDEKEYYEEVHAVLSDGEISDKERRLLEKLRKMLNISEERAKEIEAFAAKK